MLSAVFVALWAPAAGARLLPTAAAALQEQPDPSNCNFTGAIRNFTMQYVSLSNTSNTLNIYGWEPAHGSGYPVYIHGGGGGDKLDPDIPELEMAQYMAERGYVAVIIEMPTRFSVTCESGEGYFSLPQIAEFVFGYHGPDDTRSTALNTVCQREAADCSAGIGLHGLSVGGMLTALAPRFAVGVTAELRWSSGVFVAGAFSCCGGYGGNRSCCEHDGVVGGNPIMCLRDNSTSQYLDRSRRRLIMGRGDTEYGDYFCPDDGLSMGWHEFSDCEMNRTLPFSLYPQVVGSSGYDCGFNATNCIQADGSGYYIVEIDEVGGFRQNVAQSHNFHLHFDDDFADTIDPPQHTDHYFLSPEWLRSSAPWGMRPGFEWLAATARRRPC